MKNHGTSLESNKIKYLSGYSLDPVGRVCLVHDRVFRIIKSEKEFHIRKLIDKGILNALIKKKWFIGTKVLGEKDKRDLFGDEFGDTLILEHDRIFFPTEETEWTFEMFVDAAKMIKNINLYLLEYGYELSDPHYNNISFVGSKPVYMDLGSICLSSEVGGEGVDTFGLYWGDRYACYLKCQMPFTEYIRSSILLSQEGITGKVRVFSQKIRNYLFFRKNDKQDGIPGNTVRMIRKYAQKNNNVINLKKKYYSSFHFSSRKNKEKQKEHIEWGKNHDKLARSRLADDYRFKYYIDKAKDLKIEECNCLEIAGNQGLLSSYLVKNNLVKRACVTDYSEEALNKGYNRIKRSDISDRVTFVNTSFGGKNLDSKQKRFKSDVVFVLALTHHLILSQKIYLDNLVNILYGYTGKYLFVEFMPFGLSIDKDNPAAVPDWYTLDWFVDGLKEKFDIVEIKKLDWNRICIFAEPIQ